MMPIEGPKLQHLYCRHCDRTTSPILLVGHVVVGPQEEDAKVHPVPNGPAGPPSPKWTMPPLPSQSQVPPPMYGAI